MVAGFVLLVNFVVWTFPDTYTDASRHTILYACFGGIPLLLASYGLRGTAYFVLSIIYLVTGCISVILGVGISVAHAIRKKPVQ